MASVPRCARAVSAAATAAAPTRMARLPITPGAAPGQALSRPIFDFLLPSYAAALATPAASPCRGYATASPAGQPTPLRLRRSHHAQQTQHRPLPGSRRRPCGGSLALPGSTAWLASAPSRRPFSTTDRRPSTQTLLNPQMDDDGKEMRLEITSRAATRLAKVMQKDANPRLALRIQVESGGCHGFQYLMSLVTLPDHLPNAKPEAQEAQEAAADAPQAIREDDTIFTYTADSDHGADPLSAPKIILDTPSLELLNGSKVDFTTELIGSQFKIVDNPLATSSCGCGTSFDIKI